jgi:type I restriction enzyme S subunit
MKGPWIGTSEERLTEAGAQRLRRAPAETILIVVRGMILAHTLPICFAERELTFNQDVKGLIVGSSYSPRFIHAALRSREDALLALVDEAGHGTKRLPTDALFSFELCVPDLEHQTRVAQELAEIELQMEFWETHAEKLIALKRGLVASWFGDDRV